MREAVIVSTARTPLCKSWRGAFNMTHGATMGSSHDRRSRSPFSVYLDERNRLLITRRFDPVMLPSWTTKVAWPGTPLNVP